MVFETVKRILVDVLEVDEAKITPETNFATDLEADSLDVFQVIAEIEDELDIEIDTDQNLNTMAELVAYIEQVLAQK